MPNFSHPSLHLSKFQSSHVVGKTTLREPIGIRYTDGCHVGIEDPMVRINGSFHLLIHPQKLTWNLEMMVSNRDLLFQGSIFRFHVCFGGCKWDILGL